MDVLREGTGFGNSIVWVLRKSRHWALHLHLFGEELVLDEVAHLRVGARVCQLVQVEQRLVDGLLQLERGLEGGHRRAPLVHGRLQDGLHHHPAAALVLELDQLLGVVTLLVRLLLEVLVEAREGHVVTVEVGRLRGGRWG